MQRGASGTVQPDVLPEGGGREQDPGRGQEQQPQGASSLLTICELWTSLLSYGTLPQIVIWVT
jgi:hypothetical protein